MRYKDGRIAGQVAKRDGRRRVTIRCRSYLCYRVIWLMVNGKWPDGDIDHIDGNQANDAIANLRDVPHAVNLQNQRRARADNASGYLGVTPHKGKWRASIRVDGKLRSLGRYATPELAHTAYLEGKRRLHAGCTI